MTSNDETDDRARAIRGTMARGERHANNKNERVRIATALFRFSKRFNDPWIILDAMLAAAGQIAAEHDLEPGMVRESFDSFFAAARQDHLDRQIAAACENSDVPSEPVDPHRIN